MTRAMLYLQVSVRWVLVAAYVLGSLALRVLPHLAEQLGPGQLHAVQFAPGPALMQHITKPVVSCCDLTMARGCHCKPCRCSAVAEQSPAVNSTLRFPCCCSGQAVVFVVRTVKHSFLSRAGTLTYVAFFAAQVGRSILPCQF